MTAEPATYLLTHSAWRDIRDHWKETAEGKWFLACQRAAAGVMFAPLIYQRSRAEVGLLRLQQGRDRAKASLLADAFLGRTLGGTGQGESRP